MDFRKSWRTALLTATSMGVRITPDDRQSVETSNWFYMQATSAESNVLSVSAALGLPAKVLTAFVQRSPISQLIKNSLSQRHIAYEAMEVPQGGPWGYRHQFNIADSGYGMRAPRVHNDRAGEVGRLLDASKFDLKRIFEEEGVAILHLSGLIAALSPETGKFCVELARVAKQNGTRVSFDLNHRASFWKGREDELRAMFVEIASLSDILVGNEEDFQLCLGIQGPEAGGKDVSSKLESFKAMILRVKERFPNVSLYGTTLRQVISANEHLWGAILLDGDTWHYAEPREIPVLDRIGGGDGFVGGLLYGLLKGYEPEKAMRFGWATGVLATTVLEDYATPADEEQIWSIWEGNARVKR
ncbi:MAG TPA: PfkB family carbohydrate kinase [Clostridia bacterium]|nr:PfkB family carbohydrate kinase [Clostridia bacterium]